MLYSIFHFFRHITDHRNLFLTVDKLENFPFDVNLLSCGNKGKFPDMAIRITLDHDLFTGGELIELKDSKSYNIPSFNSTIPSGKKEISKVIKTKKSKIKKQMDDVGENPESLPIREVYYLIRGKEKQNRKVLLVHGSFFETVEIENLISQSFSQVVEERIKQTGFEIDDKIKQSFLDLFSEQESFSKVRNVDLASVKLRFRIMTEVKSEGNILNSTKYPEILNNTLNLVLPYHTEQDKFLATQKMLFVFGEKELNKFRIFLLKHHFNGCFLIFQIDL